MKKNKKSPDSLMTALVWVISISLVITGALLGYNNVLLYIGVSFIIVLVLGRILFSTSNKADELESFAKIKGYTYKKMHALPYRDGFIFSKEVFGDNNWYVYWSVSGLHNNHKFIFYQWLVVINVLELEVDGEGLQFLLLSKTMKESMSNKKYKLQKYVLEGDFNNYFELYGTERAHTEILRVFSPDHMAYLIDNFKDYSIELTPTTLYVYCRNSGLITNVDLCTKMIHLGEMLEKFIKNIDRIDYSSDNYVPEELKKPKMGSRI